MIGRRRTAPIDVLLVCTGNLCRSPMAATLLAAAEPALAVRSAGVAARSGAPWHPLTVQVLAEVGHDVRAGRAHRLRARDVKAASLVLTAEGMHRAHVIRMDPTAENRCFTLLEAARLLQVSPAPAGLSPAGLSEHLAAALRENPIEQDDDLPDPIQGTIEDFRTCRDHVATAVAAIGFRGGARPPEAG